MNLISIISKIVPLTLFLLVISCSQETSRSPQPTGNELTIATARTWFEKQSSSLQKGRLKNSRFNDFIPIWEKAHKGQTQLDEEFVEIPLESSKNLKWVYTAKLPNGQKTKAPLITSIKLSLVIYIEDGKITETIKEVRPDEEYISDHQNKIDRSDFSGKIFLWSWSGEIVGGSYYKNGVREGKISSVSSSSNKNARDVSCITYRDCNWSSACFNLGDSPDAGYPPALYGTTTTSFADFSCSPPQYGAGSEFSSCSPWELVGSYTYQQCQNTGPSGPGPGEGTGPTGGSTTTVDISVDPNLNDCFKGVINSVTTDRYKAYLLKRTKEVFGDNAGANNLAFKSGPAGGSLGAFNGDEKTIYLDASKLENQSNEWVATVLFHELTHAQIVEYRGGFLAPSTYDQHKEIFNAQVTNMRDALQEVYPNLTGTEALSLALQGLDDYIRDQNNNIRPEVNRAAQEKFGISLADAAANAAPYATGAKGTKCNQ